MSKQKIDAIVNEIKSEFVGLGTSTDRHKEGRRKDDSNSISDSHIGDGNMIAGRDIFFNGPANLKKKPEQHNLINCPDCGVIVSRRASSCTTCGLDVHKHFTDLGDYKHAKSVVYRATKVRNILLAISLLIAMFFWFELNVHQDILSSLALGVILLFCAPAAYALELMRSKFEKVIFRSQFYRAGDEKG